MLKQLHAHLPVYTKTIMRIENIKFTSYIFSPDIAATTETNRLFYSNFTQGLAAKPYGDSKWSMPKNMLLS